MTQTIDGPGGKSMRLWSIRLNKSVWLDVTIIKAMKEKNCGRAN